MQAVVHKIETNGFRCLILNISHINNKTCPVCTWRTPQAASLCIKFAEKNNWRLHVNYITEFLRCSPISYDITKWIRTACSGFSWHCSFAVVTLPHRIVQQSRNSSPERSQRIQPDVGSRGSGLLYTACHSLPKWHGSLQPCHNLMLTGCWDDEDCWGSDVVMRLWLRYCRPPHFPSTWHVDTSRVLGGMTSGAVYSKWLEVIWGFGKMMKNDCLQIVDWVISFLIFVYWGPSSNSFLGADSTKRFASCFWPRILDVLEKRQGLEFGSWLLVVAMGHGKPFLIWP